MIRMEDGGSISFVTIDSFCGNYFCASLYFRRRVMLVYESLEMTFDPRNVLFRDLGKILPT